jgi:hypothetical protein
VICDLCKTAFISRGSVRDLQCGCGSVYRACLTCRRALLRQDFAYYEGKGMVLKICPTALEVAQRLMDGGDGG